MALSKTLIPENTEEMSDPSPSQAKVTHSNLKAWYIFEAQCVKWPCSIPCIAISVLFLFDLILLHPSQQFFSYVGMGLPGLNQY